MAVICDTPYIWGPAYARIYVTQICDLCAATAHGLTTAHAATVKDDLLMSSRRILAKPPLLRVAFCNGQCPVLCSVLIGIALGVSPSPCTIRPLAAALVFHQTFEGFALGATLVDAEYKTCAPPN